MTLVERLRARTKRTLPNNWKKGRQCPECDSSADRPKCFFDMGAACPRHDPDNYEPSPYVIVPDLDCKDAAARIEQLEAALRPFIDAIGRIDLSREYGENRVEIHWGKGRATAVTVASFTQALAALETKHD